MVRGLEAIEQPSQVTLVTTSRYVARGLRYGLTEWRETGYIWEHFGVQKPIRNADLWQRIDGAMQFPDVACRLLESSMAQQSTAVADEAATQLDDLAVPVEEMEIARPAIPAPHFPVRPSRPAVNQPPGDQPAPPTHWTNWPAPVNRMCGTNPMSNQKSCVHKLAWPSCDPSHARI